MSRPDPKGDAPALKSYRVALRYLVIVDVEATDEDAAIEQAQLEENQTGEWETMDVTVDPLDEGEDA